MHKRRGKPRWNSTIAFPPVWVNNHRLRGTDFNARMKCKSPYLLLKDHPPFFLKIRIFSNIEQGKLVWGSVWRLSAFNGKVQKFQKSVLFHLCKLYAFNFTYLFFIYFASDPHFLGTTLNSWRIMSSLQELRGHSVPSIWRWTMDLGSLPSFTKPCDSWALPLLDITRWMLKANIWRNLSFYVE